MEINPFDVIFEKYHKKLRHEELLMVGHTINTLATLSAVECVLIQYFLKGRRMRLVHKQCLFELIQEYAKLCVDYLKDL